MKRTVLGFLLCLSLPNLATAQGIVAFANHSFSPLTYGRGFFPSLQGTPLRVHDLGDPTVPGDFRVALYWMNPATSRFEPLGAAARIAPASGRFNGGTRTTGAGTAPGQLATFQVRIWSHGTRYPTYEAALASGDPDVCVGASPSFLNATGGDGQPPLPPLPPQPLFGFTGFVLNAPLAWGTPAGPAHVGLGTQAGGLQLSVAGLTHRSLYAIESRRALDDSPWEVICEFYGTPVPRVLSLPLALDPQRFYRIRSY